MSRKKVGFWHFNRLRGKAIGRITAILLILLFCINLVACNSTQANDSSLSSTLETTSYTTYEVQGLAYEVPAAWRQEQTENGNNHYPYSENKHTLLAVYASNMDCSFITNTDILYECYEGAFEGLENEVEDFQLQQKERVKLVGLDAYRITFSYSPDYTMDVYAVIDIDHDILYQIMFVMTDETISEMSTYIDPIINSLYLNDKWFKDQSAVSSENTDIESSSTEQDSLDGEDKESVSQNSPKPSSSKKPNVNNTESPDSNDDDIANNTPDKEETPNTPSGVTSGQKNALSKAKQYLSAMPFSYDGLVKQLEYEKFSHEDAVYGAENCGADWNKQALKKATSYLDTMAFSQKGLTEQLSFEGFTDAQANYGASNCGADWNEQAAKKAKSYLDIMSFSRQELIDQLIYEGFTSEQASYGADSVGL